MLSQVVAISKGKWTEDISLQMKQRTEWEVEKLWINNNYKATMVKQIAHIRFTALTFLSLSGNRIESVEALPRVHMPHICILYLYENNITSVGVIRKAHWPALSRLSMKDNYFKDGKKLADTYFPQMKKLSLYCTQGEDTNKFTEKCFPAKVQAPFPKYLRINKSEFCCDRSITRVLRQKWPQVDIY